MMKENHSVSITESKATEVFGDAEVSYISEKSSKS